MMTCDLKWLASLVVMGLAIGFPVDAQKPAPPETATPLTLQAALQLARANSPVFRAADTAARLAAEGPQAGASGVVAVGERVQPVHLHRAERYDVWRLCQ